MRILATLLLSTFLTGLATAQPAQTIRETIPLERDGLVEIDTYKGSIEVVTWDRDEVRLEVDVESDGDDELVPLTKVRIDRSAGRLRLETDYDEAKREGGGTALFGLISTGGDYRLPLVHYRLTMPRTARLVVDDYKSTSTLTGLAADLNFTTYKGSAAITGMTGQLNLETYKGTAEIADLTGRLDLETYKGRARVQNLRGPAAISTYKGDVTLAGRVEGLRAETYKGRIDVEGLRGELDADTYKGDISARMLSLSGGVSAETYKGRVTLSLPRDAGFTLATRLDDRARLDATFGLAGLRDGENDYYGDVNGGGPRVRLSSEKGTFVLRAP